MYKLKTLGDLNSGLNSYSGSRLYRPPDTTYTTYFNYKVCIKGVVESKEHWFVHLEDALQDQVY